MTAVYYYYLPSTVSAKHNIQLLRLNRYFNIKWLIVAVIFTATVVFLTHFPANEPRLCILGTCLDKLGHVLAYGAITLFFILSLRSYLTLLSASILFFAISAVGVIDELTQPVFNRTASLTDWLADTISIFAVLLFFVCIKTWQHSTSDDSDVRT